MFSTGKRKYYERRKHNLNFSEINVEEEMQRNKKKEQREREGIESEQEFNILCRSAVDRQPEAKCTDSCKLLISSIEKLFPILGKDDDSAHIARILPELFL